MAQPPYSSPSVGQFPSPGAPRPGAPGQPQQPGDKDEKKPTRKVLSTYRNLAIIAAVLVVIILLVLLSSSGSPSAYVVTANKDLAAATSVSTDNFTITPVTDPALQVPNALTNPSKDDLQKQLNDLINGTTKDGAKIPGNNMVKVYMSKGSQLVPAFLSPDLQTLSNLQSDERLISVSANPINAVNGALVPTQHVDLVTTDHEGNPLCIQDSPIVAVNLPAQQLDNAASGNASTTSVSGISVSTLPGSYVLQMKATDANALAASGNASSPNRVTMIYRPAGAPALASCLAANPLAPTTTVPK